MRKDISLIFSTRYLNCSMDTIYFCKSSLTLKYLIFICTTLLEQKIQRQYILVCRPICIFQLQHLEDLGINDCPNFGKGLMRHNELQENASSLQRLNLSNSGILSLPLWIKGFVGLCHLILEDCKQHEEILQLPPIIKGIDARGCMSLERFPHESAESSFSIPD